MEHYVVTELNKVSHWHQMSASTKAQPRLLNRLLKQNLE